MTDRYHPQAIDPWIDPGFILQSRVHLLNKQFDGANLYIKREDELSSGVTGSKYRKYASLLPFLRNAPYDEVLLIGSAQSNNVVSALQFLNEARIKTSLFLLVSNEPELKGNLLWMYMLCQDKKSIYWIKREDWPNVMDMAISYQAEAAKQGKKVFILPEGGAVTQALPGAMTLVGDILRNEKELDLEFDHICIDSGSGTSATGLIMGLQLLEAKKNIDITLIAGSEIDFRDQYHKLVSEYNGFYYGAGFDTNLPHSVSFHKPVIGPSFGSITSVLLNKTMQYAQEEGLLMDPVYSVKHLATAEELIAGDKLKGNILFIYNGGSFGLAGFQQKLAGLFSL